MPDEVDMAGACLPVFPLDATRRRISAFYPDLEPQVAKENLTPRWLKSRLTRGKRHRKSVLLIDAGYPPSLDLSWAFEAMSAGTERGTSQQIMSTISALNELLKARQFNDIGAVFGIINPKRLSPELMLTLIRVTFPVKELIPGWYQLVRRIKNELDQRQLDSKKILVGLI